MVVVYSNKNNIDISSIKTVRVITVTVHRITDNIAYYEYVAVRIPAAIVVLSCIFVYVKLPLQTNCHVGKTTSGSGSNSNRGFRAV